VNPRPEEITTEDTACSETAGLETIFTPLRWFARK